MTTNNFNLNNNPHHQHSSLQQSVSRMNLSNQVTNGLFIRKEIQRFESVHPNIYSVYDLIDSISDFNLQQQIREHIVNIEDSFVNSQEWTLGRSVPDIKIGILGANNSGKSSLVHRFLTGTYMQEESPEGGRFKKEVIIDGQSYLLLIRDEGGPPEMQFSHWVDAVIFVFSLENEESFMSAHQLFNKLHNYRNVADIPILLVGTQDFISETNPRVIDDARAHSLANKFQKCGYFETCATYGLNVERVFHDACQKVVNSRAFQVHQVFSSRLTPVASAHCNFRFSNVAELKSDHLAENDCSNSSSPTQSVANVIVNNAPVHFCRRLFNLQIRFEK
jgi:Arf-GAP/GTPase/ANK repeat/PH domain-containing protein 1/3